jgi:uncharacterized protein with GYD domain
MGEYTDIPDARKLQDSEELLMAIFISLFTFTDQGIRHVDETTKRADAFNDFAQRVGDAFNDVVYWAVERHNVVVKDIYWTQGVYDGIIILDAPDAETAMSLFLHLDSLGDVRTQSFQAFSRDEMASILAKAG